MGRRTNKIKQFIELEVNRPFSERGGLDLEYHCVNTKESRGGLKRVYFRLFDEIMAQHRDKAEESITYKDSKMKDTL